MRIIIDRDYYADRLPEVGDLITLLERENVRTGARYYRLGPAIGATGNADPSIRRFHGWRGTTNDISVTALGLRRIEKITPCKNGNFWITLSADLKPDED